MKPAAFLNFITIVLLLVCASNSLAEPAERRRDQYGKDFGYYVYPIAGEIPGLGTATGIGASVLNVGESDTDFTGYYVRGDFDATGFALLDYHVLPRRLIFDVGYNDYLVAAIAYDRGINSDPNDVIYPKAEGKYLLSQLTLSYDDRRYEAFVRLLVGRERLLEVLDKDRVAFEGVDTDWDRGHLISAGGSLDLTDDRLDPRRGVRFEFNARLPTDNDPAESEYFVNDYNLTGYWPLRRWDTLAFNLFYSRAHITRHGEEDYGILQQLYGLDCDRYPPGPEADACLRAESKFLTGVQANNRYGTATALGGTQRLRSYDNGRFYAGQTLFYGVEYRWNLTDEFTPFDIIVAKGIRTGIQLAMYWEHGMVADHFDDLVQGGRSSYGIGARVILSGVIIRLDLAKGDEGTQSQLFITYPWSMFSVDNPG